MRSLSVLDRFLLYFIPSDWLSTIFIQKEQSFLTVSTNCLPDVSMKSSSESFHTSLDREIIQFLPRSLTIFFSYTVVIVSKKLGAFLKSRLDFPACTLILPTHYHNHFLYLQNLFIFIPALQVDFFSDLKVKFKSSEQRR